MSETGLEKFHLLSVFLWAEHNYVATAIQKEGEGVQSRFVPRRKGNLVGEDRGVNKAQKVNC